MIKLRALRLTNFRSFKKRQTFTFPAEPGLYFMWGDNQTEPRLNANGAGKSTVWKALTWLIFGKTSEGLKAGDACNWEAGKGTEVELEFDAWGIGPWSVTRTWGPNSWYMTAPGSEHKNDLTKDPTNPLMDELRLEFQSFLACILMAQGQPMFLDLKAEAKAALFAEVMGLDKWVGYSDKASARAKDVDRELRQVEGQVSSLTGRIEAARSVDVKAQLAEWEENRKRRRDSLEHEYRGLVQRHKDLKDRLTEYDVRGVETRARYKIALESVEDAEAQLKRARLGDYGTVGVHSCPTCGQSVSDAIAILIDKVAAAKKIVAAHLRDMDDAAAAIRSGERDILSVDKALDSLELREDQILAEVNPFTKMHTEGAAQIADLKADLEEAVDRQDALSARLSILSGWVRWFKEIRLGLIGEALEQLEIEVNSCVTALGLVDWELRFDVDKETAKGTLQRGFSVSVLSPHNTKAVPWEAWSGGEAQRLRVATNMGLANLIRQRTGCDMALEVWDEPTNFMSPQGVTDLLDSLKARALNEQRQIWVVDHRTLGYADFDGSVGVVKTTAGSTFVDGEAYSSRHAAQHLPSHAAGHQAHDDLRRRARTA